MSIIKILPLIFLVSCGNFWWGKFFITDARLGDNLEIIFSSPPASQTVKNAFSLHGDGKEVQGTIEFNGEKAIFYPAAPFSSSTEYTLNVSTLAENERGVSLEKNYWKVFNEKSHRPFKIIDFSPKNETIMEKTDFSIEILFSDPVDEKSFTDAFSVSPNVNFIFRFSEDKTAVTAMPTEEFSLENTYTVKISDTLLSADNRSLGKQYTSVFAFTEDFSLPEFSLFSVYDDQKQELSEKSEFLGFPNNGIIRIEFSKEINSKEISSYIQIRPEIGKTIVPDKHDKKIVEIEFTEAFPWNETYVLTMKKGIPDLWGNVTSEEKQFSFVTNNEKDRAITFLGIALDCGENPTDEPIFFSSQDMFSDVFFDINRFPPVQSAEAGISSKIFLFFSLSKTSNISLKSAMENTDIQVTNSCIDFSLRKIRICDELPISGEFFNDVPGKLVAVEFTSETKNFNRNGLIKLKIYEELSDEIGNSMDGDVDFILNKKNEI